MIDFNCDSKLMKILLSLHGVQMWVIETRFMRNSDFDRSCGLCGFLESLLNWRTSQNKRCVLIIIDQGNDLCLGKWFESFFFFNTNVLTVLLRYNELLWIPIQELLMIHYNWMTCHFLLNMCKSVATHLLNLAWPRCFRNRVSKLIFLTDWLKIFHLPFYFPGFVIRVFQH